MTRCSVLALVTVVGSVLCSDGRAAEATSRATSHGDCKTLYSKHLVDFRYNQPAGLARAYVRVQLDQWPGSGSLSVVDGAQVSVRYGALTMSGQIRTVHQASNGIIRANRAYKQVSFEWTPAFSASALSSPFQSGTHQTSFNLSLSVSITTTDGATRVYSQIPFSGGGVSAPAGSVPLGCFVTSYYPNGNVRTSTTLIAGQHRLALPYLQP